MPKSRYDSVERYISNHWFNRPEYNDRKPLYDEAICARLQKNGKGSVPFPVTKTNPGTTLGIDELLAKHISYLFIRDPIVIFSEMIDQDDTKSNDHFEVGQPQMPSTCQLTHVMPQNLQSTNWQTVRFKPPGNSSIGWRVEFRSMEVQMTDFENAAFSAFIVLLTRAILAFNINFYLPISKVSN